MTNYLGIDYGKKHLGLAIADGPLARPISTIQVNSPSESIPTISRLVTSNQIDQVVIGLPGGNLDEEIRIFGDHIERVTHIPVIYHEETLTTHEALQSLRESGASKKKLQNDHVYAACLILEDYLEQSSTNS